MNPFPPYFLLDIQASRAGLQRHDLDTLLTREAERPASYLRRVIAGQLARQRPEAGIHEGGLLVWAVINRVLRHLVLHYCRQRGAQFRRGSLEAGDNSVTLERMPRIRRTLVALYPPEMVLRGLLDGDGFLHRYDGDETALVAELFLLALHQQNPALARLRPLFQDDELEQTTRYRELVMSISQLLHDLPGHRSPETLWQILRAPIEASPDSLEGQLAYLRTVWGHLLPTELLQEIDLAFDLVAEVMATRRLGHGALFGFGFGDAADRARFTPDAAWMPRTVLLAKSVHVWLNQLSRQYRHGIHHLDQIPDEELDRIAGRGFNALWLIGCWCRSDASRKIKHLCGDPEAAASAYALDDYVVADDLGGEGALHRLEERCWARGLRLACDIVPNHTGLDSRWMREAPDDFIQLPHPPYPAYRFTGPDLSDQPGVSIRIEDGYFNRSDAAVVFEHRDHGSGRVRYIYHGNDGTHTPWNDTAQLDYLKAHVRERMIQTILAIARRFSVIRFDAAMTLAKKHFQRLWYPQPGGGAGVPSRADHWMDRDAFEAAFPAEFWREVVDRVQAEVPETLLIAEAFWLMEGYFVRTLGMHRVYNSAFMNMLKQEANGKHRQLIRDVLLFNPGILQRFVNFLSNPDEATAIEQFGRDDKYFGAATLLATMPGLPMFAHGQIEGLKEKYGMEFRSARWDEPTDGDLVARHERQIFPLLRDRALFSGADNFQLYDFCCLHGTDENVYAYSNRLGDEAALVVFNNRYGDSSGWLHFSVDKVLGDVHENPPRESVSLGAGLGLDNADRLYRFIDVVTGLEYLRTGEELHRQGFGLQLGAYGHHVFWRFRTVDESDPRWRALWQRLGGRGIHDLDFELGGGRQLPPLPIPQREAVSSRKPLKILFVASEVAPFAKSGGLADVAGALPPVLQQLGHQLRVVLPAYPCTQKPTRKLVDSGQRISLHLDGRDYEARVLEGQLGEVPVWLLDQPELFDRDGLYGDAGGDYDDNPLRFAFLSRAALELARQQRFAPDVVHVHDWQTALIPALLKTDYADDAFFSRTASVLTIHNLGYQGLADIGWIERLHLHPGLAGLDAFEYYGQLALLKGGIRFADRVNTVSPTYCQEICGPEQGHGLDGLLRATGDALSGILNGLDADSWNPATDPALPANYRPSNTTGKKRCKAALQQELGLEIREDIPLVVMVSRLDRQKGVDLVLQAWDRLKNRELQLVVLGTGAPHYAEFLRHHAQDSPGRFATLLHFDEDLSRRIYAGGDILLMPSLYEPCGLAQMIGLRYGTLPLVRRTGGLADTVVDLDIDPKGNGFTFVSYNADAMMASLDRALGWYKRKKLWKSAMVRGMKQDLTWSASAQVYVDLYRQALASPRS